MVNTQLRRNPTFLFPACVMQSGRLISYSLFLISLTSCSIQKQISKSATKFVINDSSLLTAHVGISIYEPATNKYWYNYQGDKFFVPASNTKIPTCYAAMKYLGDSLVGLRYGYSEEKDSSHKVLGIQPTGDPTLFHPDFKKHPVWDFLSLKANDYKDRIAILDTIWQDDHWGSGWSWNDYDAEYMAERNAFPIYGNVIDIKLNKLENRKIKDTSKILDSSTEIEIFKTQHRLFDSIIKQGIIHLIPPKEIIAEKPKIRLKRSLHENQFSIDFSQTGFESTSIPFVTHGDFIASWIIGDLLNTKFGSLVRRDITGTNFIYYCPSCMGRAKTIKNWKIIHSQPTDSLLKPMMHRSDNFFAEQTLLMVSNELLGVMSDEKIIDTLLKTDFKDLPQRPRWADGSGLSRYNLFTPQSLIGILNKMKNEFGMERIKIILPTGGEGTISSYYRADSGYIYAKTGTLSGVVALSGFLYTKKNKLLVFSVLVNNHRASATNVRRAVEKFIQEVRNKF